MDKPVLKIRRGTKSRFPYISSHTTVYCTVSIPVYSIGVYSNSDVTRILPLPSLGLYITVEAEEVMGDLGPDWVHTRRPAAGQRAGEVLLPPIPE